MYVLSMKENTNLKLYPAIFLVSFAVRISPSLFSNPHDLHHLTKQCFNETFWEIMHYKTKYTGDSLQEEVLLCFKVHCKNLPKNNPVFYSVHSFIEQSRHYSYELLTIVISCSNEDEKKYIDALYSFIAFFHLCVLVTVGNQQPESVCMYHNI